MMSENKHALPELIFLKKDWPYFIEKPLETSEKENFELEKHGTEIDSVKNELLLDTVIDFEISKHFYNTVYNTVAEHLW